MVIIDGQKKNVLRIYDSSKTLEKVREEVYCLSFLHKNSFPVPTIILNHQGSPITEIDGRIGILQEFIQGCHIQKYDEQSCGQIGKVLAQLHKLSIKYTFKGPGVESGTVIKPDHLEKIEIATIKDVRVKMLIQNASAFRVTTEGLEQGWIHRDFNRSHLLFTATGKIVAVLDFDDAKPGYFAENIGAILWDY